MAALAVVQSEVDELVDDVLDHLPLREGRLRGRKEAFGSYMWLIGLAQKPNDILGIANARVPVFGAALHDFMKQAARGLAKMQAQAEEVPNPENRVVLADRKDDFGFPLARIIHSLDQEGMRLFNYELALGLRIMRATRAKEAWTDATPTFAHMTGGTVMGKTAADSITDSYGRTHEVANLFVGGPGVFPTSSSVNSTFTAHALATKGARFLAQNWMSLKS